MGVYGTKTIHMFLSKEKTYNTDKNQEIHIIFNRKYWGRFFK